jgi:hypothetical protein
VAIIEDLAAVPRAQVGRVVGSADGRRYEITRALDISSPASERQK